jgi:hypothetical protein
MPNFHNLDKFWALIQFFSSGIPAVYHKVRKVGSRVSVFSQPYLGLAEKIEM